MKRARRICLALAVALTAVTAFLLPLKFGGIAGLAEVPGTIPGDLWEWIFFTSLPTEFFAVVSAAALLLTVAGGAVRLPESRMVRLTLYLWGVGFPLAVLPGFVNTAVRDYAFAHLVHWLSVGAWCWTTALLLADDPRRKKLFVGALMAGFLVSVLAGWRLRLWGFAETRRYFARMEEAGRVKLDPQLWIKLNDDRVYATFTSCNSFAGFLILAGAAFALAAAKFGERFEPRKISRPLLFAAAALLTLPLLPLTRSRGALLCALLAGVGAFLCSRLPRAVKIAGLSLFIAAGVGGAWYVHHKGRGFSSGAERLDYLATTAQLVAAHPVCGAGWDGFFREHMRVKRTGSDEAAHDPHNLAASFAGQAGVLSGVLALAALILPLWALFRRYRKFGPWRRAVCWGCAAAALHMLMELDYLVQAQLAAFWLLALAALIEDAPETDSVPAAKFETCAAAGAAAATALAALALGVWVLRGDLAFAGFSALVTPEPGTQWHQPSEKRIGIALDEVRRSRQHLPFALEKLAGYRMPNAPAEAEKLLLESLELSGPRPSLYAKLAETARRSGDEEKAASYWRRAHELFPAKYPRVQPPHPER